MNKVHDGIWSGLIHMGMILTFGAYYQYRMDTRWKLQQDIRKLQDEKIEAMMEEMKQRAKQRLW